MLARIETRIEPSSDTELGSGRRKFTARLGAAILGATAAQLFRANAADAHPPGGCVGFNSCAHHGGYCPGISQGSCCWVICYGGSVYRCCDHFINGSTCICRYRIMNC